MRRSALGHRVAGIRRAGLAEVRPWASGSLVLLSVVAVLLVIGLVMVLSSSSVQALRAYGSSWLFFKRQVLWVAVGAAAMFGAARLDYRVWQRLATPLLVTCIALLCLVLVPGLGISVNGSTRWLGAGAWRIQPSELAKLAVGVFAAALLARRAGCDDPRLTTRPVVIVLLVVLGLVLAQPDMGTSLIVAGVGLAVLFVGGTPLATMGRLAGAGAVAAFVVSRVEPYRWRRMTAFWDPWKDAGNTGYQSIQALVGLGTGQITGVGLGASRAKWGFLPNAHTDFIFAIVGEELGLIGTLLVVGLFCAFAVLGVRTALRAPDRFGTYLAAAITAWVVGQAFLNMGAVIGILPVTGVPLPFVSFGGSSLVVLMAAVGIVLNIARQGR